MIDKNNKIFIVSFATIFGIALALLLKNADQILQKPVSDYFFALGSLIVAPTLIFFAFTPDMKEKKASKKLVFWGSVVFVCSIIQFVILLA